MMKRLERDELQSELAAVETVLASIPAEDFVARISLENRRAELRSALEQLEQATDNEAAVAIYLEGKPVIGSRAIRADFATNVLSEFQDLVTKTWFTQTGEQLGMRGPIPIERGPDLHITGVAHGSFGFILEELDENPNLFPSSLKLSVERAAAILSGFTDANDERFTETIENLHPRVFSAVRDFFKELHTNDALVRLVTADTDQRLDHEAIARGYDRAESSSIDEREIESVGQLLGLIPIAGRFEFQLADGTIISGRVGETLSESYLERIEREKMEGRVWHAKLRWREVKRFGKKAESYTLLDLQEHHPQTRSEP